MKELDNMSEAKNKENMEKVKGLIEQSEAVRLGKELEEGVYIDYTSAYGGSYKGNVVFKRPSMQDYMKMGALKSEYLRQAGVTDITLVDNSIKEMATAVATLTVIVVKRPEWLQSLMTIQDPDLIFHIYNQYETWEGAFRTKRAPESTGDSGAS